MRIPASSRTKGMQMGYITLCVRAGDATSKGLPWQPGTWESPEEGKDCKMRVAQGSLFGEAAPKGNKPFGGCWEYG